MIKNETPNRVELNYDTREMYQTFTEHLYDMSSDDPNFPGLSADNQNLLQSLMTGDIDGIRQGFKDGMTFFVVNSNEVDRDDGKETEIRVFHQGKLIGIIIDSEILF